MQQKLIIDPEFKAIIPPLSKAEYYLLEDSLITEGCREPLRLWEGIIIDGHNRYEICTRLGIPFKTISLPFQTRDDVISWICLNQLSRRNLNVGAYRYLIGKRYAIEKVIAKRRNKYGANQYSAKSNNQEKDYTIKKQEEYAKQRTSAVIGREYNLNHTTVENYGKFSNSLDKIEKQSPGLLGNVLSGSINISKQTAALLASLPNNQIGLITSELNKHLDQNHRMSIKDTSHLVSKLHNYKKKDTDKPKILPEIKQMPVYDPDAKINGLLLTMPTWISTITRIVDSTNFSIVSGSSKAKLILVIQQLQSAIMLIKNKTEESNHGN